MCQRLPRLATKTDDSKVGLEFDGKQLGPARESQRRGCWAGTMNEGALLAGHRISESRGVLWMVSRRRGASPGPQTQVRGGLSERDSAILGRPLLSKLSLVAV